MIKVGIIGCGRITEYRHAPEYLENKDVELLGFSDVQSGRAKLMAEKFGGRDYGSTEALLADPEIDAVSVCVANVYHAEVTLAALKAGKHVLLEKPMAATLKECEDIARAAKESGKIVMLGHNQRFAPAHIKAREMIANGAIGRVLSFHTVFGHGGPEVWTHDPNSWFMRRDRAAFGVLGDLGIHKTDLIHFLLDEPIVEVSAQMGTLNKRYADGTLIDLEDNATALYRTRSGAMGTMHVSWTFTACEENSTRIYGTKGVLRLYDDPRFSLIHEPAEGEVQQFRFRGLTSNEEQKAGKRENTGVINAFVESIVTGRRPPVDAQEALKAMRVVFAAIESAGSGRSVAVDQE